MRQPMSIDKLPIEVRDKIVELRGPQGRSWMEIEELSKSFVPWPTLPSSTQALFPGKYLPHSNLHRWYDVRVAQVMKENLEERAFALELAGAFRTAGFEGLDESVRNAAAKEIFLIARSAKAGDKKNFRKELLDLGELLVKNRRVDVQQQKVDIERRKLALIGDKVNGLKKATAKKQLKPEELQEKLDEIYGLTTTKSA